MGTHTGWYLPAWLNRPNPHSGADVRSELRPIIDFDTWTSAPSDFCE
jgi:hypothetical protein